MVKMEKCVDTEIFDVQRKKVEECAIRKLCEGDTWHVVDRKWFEALKAYIGLSDTIDSREPCHPGPIDNSGILDDDQELKKHLTDGEDYVLVPDDIYKLLEEWYGIEEGQHPIPRTVEDVGQFSGILAVEVYLMELELHRNFNCKKPIKHKFSRKAKPSELHETARRLFEIPEDKETRLYTSVAEDSFSHTNVSPVNEDESTTLLGEIVFPNAKIILAVDGEEGSVPPKCQEIKSDIGLTQPFKKADGSKTTPIALPSPSQNATSPSMTTRYSPMHITPGLCGLSNLGNTCFMNSVLQCMSNTPPIVDYFLNDLHQKDLNVENPLGMRGEIAKAFGELIKSMWSGVPNTIPHCFKVQVSKFAPQFSGYQQHDAQELLTFLLDGLHEDLNRIHDKPYIMQRDSEGRPDEVVAAEAWNNYLKRNDSIIVELFHGQLKSTVWCPFCKITSVTFDPLCYLSLPLPTKLEKTLDVIFYPYSGRQKPTQYKVQVPQRAQMKDVFKALSKLTDHSEDRMVAAEILKHHFQKIFDPSDTLDSFIEDRELLHVYQIPVSIHDKKWVILPVCQWELDSSRDFAVNQLFGQPVFVVVPRQGCTSSMLFEVILLRMAPYLKIRLRTNADYEGDSEQYAPGRISRRVIRSFLGPHDANSEDDEMEDDDTESEPSNMECQDSVDISLEYSESGTSDSDMFEFWGKDDNSERVHMNCNGNAANQNPSFGIFIVHNNQKIRGLATPDMETKVLVFPEVFGRQYLVVQWTTATRREYFKDSSVYDIVKHESVNGYARPNGVDLKDCLTLYTTTEKLDQSEAWYCPRCKDHIEATKKFDLWNLPRILVIHLKRFQYNRFRRDKIDTTIFFPLRGLNMKDYITDPNYKKSTVYDLIGVCNHYGNLAGGHYTAYGLNKVEKAWYLFDDNHVRKTSESSVVSNNAYVLFYMRRDAEDTNQ